nr:DNA methyltransferase [Halalkalibacter wakoensis]
MSFLENESQTDNEPVVCLGLTFDSETERREHFRNELRKKLPELKEIEGFPIGEDEDIIALSDPPYYTACPNPWVKNFIAEWEKEKVDLYRRNPNEDYHREPFSTDVSEGKYDPIYKLHPYPTKVPHKAIMRYILHYTKPGDVIFDGFSGTGMAGVAAQLCGDKTVLESLDNDISEKNIGSRKVILNDLSVIGSYLSYHHNKPIRNKEIILELLDELEEEINWMYTTVHNTGNIEKILEKIGLCESVIEVKEVIKAYKSYFGRINYVAWSEVFSCPNCSNEIIFWENCVDKENGKVYDKFKCSNCNSISSKRDLEKVYTSNYDEFLNKTIKQNKYVPVLINYSYGTTRYEKVPDQFDLILLEQIENVKFESNIPLNQIPIGDKTGEPIRSGITHVHHFYTRRNLKVLSEFLSVIDKREFGFSLTKVANQITKMYRFTNQSGKWGAGGGPLSGTLYIPSLIKELSMFNQLRLAIRQQFEKEGSFELSNFAVTNNSSTDLKMIPNNSIDYIFIDPPFGSNLMYSELNFIWDTWLNLITNNKDEAIINNNQKKKIEDYRYLIVNCFKEIYRILKSGHWLTIEFSNTKSSVWNAIQFAIQEAGFIIANVSVLDKKKGSFKVVTTTTAVKQDLVISAYKPNKKAVDRINQFQNTEESAWEFITQHLQKLPIFIGVKGNASTIPERTSRILFDRMVAYHVQNNIPVPISSAKFQEKVVQRFSIRDGMIFLENQVAEYDKKRILVKEFSDLSLFVSDEGSAIEWIRQHLMKKPQTRQDIHPNFMKEIQHIAKHEQLPELDDLLLQNFLKYEGDSAVPDQIASYLRRNYKDLRGLENEDEQLKQKALNRWFVPDPNKQADLEKLREKSLLREFDSYLEELAKNKKKLKQFRTEAIRAGFKKAWGEKDFEKIVTVGERLPESVIQEDDKLLMYFDNAQIRLGL